MTVRKKAVRPPCVLIASGASGGHLFPAIAVGQMLSQKSPVVPKPMDVTVVLGGRKFSEIVEKAGLKLVRLPAAGFNDRGPVGLLWAVGKLLHGVGVAFALVRKTRPVVVLGTGGYASVALLVAAKVLGVRTIIHEQNVLPGRANRLLAKVADVVLLTFEESRRYFAGMEAKLQVVGTPLRAEILAAAAKPRAVRKDDVFTLLVLGGSQGARILSEVVPEVVGLMGPKERATLRVVHQARPEDVVIVEKAYAKLGLHDVVVKPFFDDMPARYAAADLLIGRSGVGTVLEAAAFGIPAIYVPLELADGHQKLNAGVVEKAGAAVVVEQSYFTPANVLVHVRAIRQDEARQDVMRKAAKRVAKLDAVDCIARLICDECNYVGSCSKCETDRKEG